MMFMLNTSFSLQIIALALSTFVFAWGMHKGSGIAKFIGFITMIIAIISLVCSLYFTFRIWQEGRMIADAMHGMPAATDMQNQDNAKPAVEKPAAKKKS